MKLYYLSFLLLFTSCYHSIDDSKTLSCIQIVDQNDQAETISIEEKLSTFETVNFLNPQPYKQVLRVYKKNHEGKSPFILTRYFANGQIAEYLEGFDMTANGKYEAWHSNGNKKIEATVIGGPGNLNDIAKKSWLFDGVCKAWDIKGHLHAKINYQKGFLEGDSLYYFPSGTLKEKIPYQRNKIHGEVCKYFEDQKLLAKWFYEENVKEGSCIGYFENGHVAFLEEYQGGQLLTGVYYTPEAGTISEIQKGKGIKSLYEDGYLTLQEEYSDGVQKGKVKKFDQHQTLISQWYCQEGKKQGKETLYYSYKELPKKELKHRKKMEIEWDQDLIHGTIKTWYKNGQLESEKQYYKNRKNGPQYFWYKNGKVLAIEEYESDKLTQGKYFRQTEKKPISKVIEGKGTATFYDGETGSFIRKVTYLNGLPQEHFE